MRYLENSYDKTKLKIDEATHLRRIYEDIKKKLEVVKLNFRLYSFYSNWNTSLGNLTKISIGGTDQGKDEVVKMNTNLLMYKLSPSV